MTGASKILTVSYGTFSCTLEGFDDPFNTMKAIAEYFRDLAAEDRYFGAEPPQPDAAMLHKIAEREIQRRVEAKIEANGVTLRAGPDVDQARISAEPEVEAPRPVVHMPAAPARKSEAAHQGIAPSLADADTVTSSVAEKLSLMRRAAVISQDQGSVSAATLVVDALDTTTGFDHSFTDDDYAEDLIPQLSPTSADDIFAGMDFAEVAEEGGVEASGLDQAEPESAPLDLADEGVDAAVSDTPVDTPAPVLADEVADSADTDTPAETATSTDRDTELADTLAALTAADILPETEVEPEEEAYSIADLATLDGAETGSYEGEAAPEDAVEAPADTTADLSAPDDSFDVAFDEEDTAALLSKIGADDAASPAAAFDDPPAAAADDTALLAALGQLIDPEEDDFEDEPSVEVIADTMEADNSLTYIAAISEVEVETVIVATPNALPSADLQAQGAPLVEGAAPEEASPAPEEFAETEEQDGAAQSEPMAAEPAAEVPEAEELAAEEMEAETPLVAAPGPAPGPVRPTRPVRILRAEQPDERPAPLPEATAPAATAPVAEPITISKLQRARARVIKIRRTEPTVGDGGLTVAAPVLPARIIPRRVLTDEAEAALAAELADLESAEERAETGTVESAGVATATPAPRHEGRATIAPTEDEAVARLMDEAGTQMDGPDTKRRQSAIAHLKAAVAATLAERKATGNTLAGDGKGRFDAYRSDLAAVVRPNAGTGASLTADLRPAPLVLVSEQRIDRPAPMAAVQPRRVSASGAATAIATQTFDDEDFDHEDENEDAANIFGASDGFVDFAERLGANDLPGLLEAAAAYIACVEGRDSFTRPQLMRHIAAAQDDIGREDGLRSFGILLRDGVIEKTRRGQFALSENSAFLAEARKIAG